MTSNRLKRPTLERDRPIRTWSTLFGPPHNGVTPPGPSAPGREGVGAAGGAPPPVGVGVGVGVGAAGQTIADAVEAGYRVINDYMRQGQAAAQGFTSGAAASPGLPGASPDMQQLAQRVLQYGWDFAGLWFEMWTRMGGNATGWPSPGGGAPLRPGEWAGPPAAPAEQATPPSAAAEKPPMRLSVSLVSERRTSARLEFRAGPAGTFVAHALRAEGQEAPPIRDVNIEAAAAGDEVTVRVVVASSQPPGVYNGMIIDEATNVPRGTISVRVFDETDR
jgi:hypothetical protein